MTAASFNPNPIEFRLCLVRKEIAIAMGKSTRTIDRLVAKGVLPSYVEEGTRYFPVASVLDYIARRMAETKDANEPTGAPTSINAGISAAAGVTPSAADST